MLNGQLCASNRACRFRLPFNVDEGCRIRLTDAEARKIASDVLGGVDPATLLQTDRSERGSVSATERRRPISTSDSTYHRTIIGNHLQRRKMNEKHVPCSFFYLPIVILITIIKGILVENVNQLVFRLFCRHTFHLPFYRSEHLFSPAFLF